MYGLQRTVAPVNLPVTTDEARLHARIDDDAIDSDIALMVSAATEEVEGVIGRQIISATFELTLECFPDVIRLPMGKTSSVSSVTYYDADDASQTLAGTEYALDAAREPAVVYSTATNSDWPATYERPDAVKVTYVAGYGANNTDVPAGLRVAILMLFAYRWEHRGDEVSNTSFGTRLPGHILDLAARYESGDEFHEYDAPNSRMWKAY